MPRTKLFDETEVLEKAMDLFWKKGFSGTSIQDLVNHLGINRASIYHTYGDKQKLFERSLHHYRKQNNDAMDACLTRSKSAFEAIHGLFNRAIDQQVTGKEAKGCFMAKMTAELAIHEPKMMALAQESQFQMQSFFDKLLRKAKQEGSISPDLAIPDTATYLYALYNGLMQVSIVNRDRPSLERMVDLGLRILQS